MGEVGEPDSGQVGLAPARSGAPPVIATLVHAVYCAGVTTALEHLGCRPTVIPKELGRSNWALPAGACFTFLGKDLTGYMRERWESDAWGPSLPREYAEGEGAYEWVRRERPQVVMTWNDEYPRYRGAVLAALECGIPTVEICHGSMYLPQHGDWRADKLAEWQLGSANYVAWASVMGAQGRRVLTGSVEQDPYIGCNVPALRLTARHELQIPEAAPTVCVLTDAPFERSTWQDQKFAYHATFDLLRAARLAQLALPGLQVVVKVHPYERTPSGERIKGEDYGRVMQRLGYTADYTVVDDPLVVALAAVDLVVGRPSSAMATALCLGIPCVVWPHTPFFPTAWFKGRGFVVVRDARELLEEMVELLAPPAPRMLPLVEETTDGSEWFAGRGDAAVRSARIVAQLARGGDPGDNGGSPEPGARHPELDASGPVA